MGGRRLHRIALRTPAGESNITLGRQTPGSPKLAMQEFCRTKKLAARPGRRLIQNFNVVFLCAVCHLKVLGNDVGLVAENRGANPAPKEASATHPQRRWHLHHKASEGRAHGSPEWQAAMEALILVATLGGPTMFARIGVMRALNRHTERVFNPDRKDHH